MVFKIFKNLIKSDLFLYLILMLSLSRILGFFSNYLLILLVPIVIQKNILNFDKRFSYLYIFLFSLFYCIFSFSNNTLDTGDFFYYLLYPTLFYLIGFYVFKKLSYLNHLAFYFLIISVQSLFFIIPIFRDIFSGTLISAERRFIIGDYELAVTLVGVSFGILSSGLFMIFTKPENKILKKFQKLFVIQGFFGVLGSVFFVNRSVIVIVFINFLFIIILNLYFLQFKRTLKYLLISFLMFVFFLLTPYSNSIIKAYEARELNESAANSFQSGGGRLDRWLDGIDNIIFNPFGGGDSEYFFAHNLWIDVGKVAGIIPLFLLIFITIRAMISLYKLILNKKISMFYKTYFTSLFLSFLLTCFIEPITQGAFQHFLLFMLMCGFLQASRMTKHTY